MSKPKATASVPDSDLAIASGQLGRTVRDVTAIAARCPFGRPAVIESAPILAGKPNPNLLYLTCPTATVAISTIEAGGGVKRFKALAREDPELRRALHQVIEAYKRRRGELAPQGDPRPEAGIGGPPNPEKASCLHAYAASLLAALSHWLGAPAAEAAEEVWHRFLPARESLWCADDRCARWGPDSAGPPAAEEAAEAAPEEEAGHLPALRVAAIDVGTISVRLLVADILGGRPEQVLRRAEITRLGEGLLTGGALNPVARDRTGRVVAGFIAQARDLGADRILVAGTSACRDATDGAVFLQGLAETHQVKAILLTGPEEAALAYAGASLDIPDHPVVLDVGGGSTELIRGTREGAVQAVSLALGASRGTERWIASDPPRPEELDDAAREAAALIEPLWPRFGAGRARLVGVAGTVTTLACLDAALEAYDAEVIHLRTLSLGAVEHLIAYLAGMTTAERAALPCVQAGRAPVIVAGALIVSAAMKALGHTEMTVSERDILDGLALSAAC